MSRIRDGDALNQRRSKTLQRRSKLLQRYSPFKCVLAGEGATGKTSLLKRIKHGYFSKTYSMTIGGDVVVLDLVVNNINVRLLCWDSSGQSRFSCVRQAFYRGMKGFIIVFDISWRGSFETVRSWYYELQKTTPDVPFVLVGNKIDLKTFRQISQEEARTLAIELGAVSYIETSAKTGVEARTPFEKLTEQMILRQKTDYRMKRLTASIKSKGSKEGADMPTRSIVYPPL